MSTRKRSCGIVSLRSPNRNAELFNRYLTVVRHVVGCYEDNKHCFLYCSKFDYEIKNGMPLLLNLAPGIFTF